MYICSILAGKACHLPDKIKTWPLLGLLLSQCLSRKVNTLQMFCFYVFLFKNFYVHLITNFPNCCAVLLFGIELRITCNLVAQGIIFYSNSSSVK